MRLVLLVSVSAAALMFTACDSDNGSGGGTTPGTQPDASGGSETTGGGDTGGSGQCVADWRASSSDFRGSDALGTACNLKDLQSTCQSGYCVGTDSAAFCSAVCSGDADCGGLTCQAVRLESGDTGHVCVPAGRTLCDQPLLCDNAADGICPAPFCDQDPDCSSCDDAFDGVCPPDCPMDPDC